jgi:hypothetical protein
MIVGLWTATLLQLANVLMMQHDTSLPLLLLRPLPDLQ